jgi:hypothetical protein
MANNNFNRCIMSSTKYRAQFQTMRTGLIPASNMPFQSAGKRREKRKEDRKPVLKKLTSKRGEFAIKKAQEDLHDSQQCVGFCGLSQYLTQFPH